jgi:hypothetical protein
VGDDNGHSQSGGSVRRTDFHFAASRGACLPAGRLRISAGELAMRRYVGNKGTTKQGLTKLIGCQESVVVVAQLFGVTLQRNITS